MGNVFNKKETENLAKYFNAKKNKDMSKLIEDIDILKEVEIELKRFTKTLKGAIKAKEKDKWNVKGFASAKRGAMDLKNELTKLTQSSRYKYEDDFLK